jgi:hypothetical protein
MVRALGNKLLEELSSEELLDILLVKLAYLMNYFLVKDNRFTN